MSNIHHVNCPIGCATCFQGSILETLKLSIRLGMYSTQFFMGSPQRFNRAVIKDIDIVESKKYLEKYPMSVYTHFPYVANLCGSIKSLAWSGNIEQDTKTGIALDGLQYELNTLAKLCLPQSGVVIHPGSFPDRERGIKVITQSINKLDFSQGGKLLLENTAGQGTTLGTTFLELKNMMSSLNNPDNVGVCIDTCHLFAFGDYNISSVEEMKRMFQDFETQIGLKKLWLVHLNDSIHPLKSRRDEHATLGSGFIWKNGVDSLVYLVKKCKKLNIPMILETNITDMITISNLEID